MTDRTYRAWIRAGIAVLAVGMAAQLVLLAVPGCQAVSPVIAQPAAAWVQADRATYDVVAPRLANYVQNDPSLPALERAQIMELLVDWEIRLVEAEKVWATPTGGTSSGGAGGGGPGVGTVAGGREGGR